MSTINADTLSVKNLSVTGTLSYADVTAQTGLPASPAPGTILETLVGLCDGRSITVASGTYTLENVTAELAATTSFVDVPGSAIAYKPPTGTKTVIYEFDFQQASIDANGRGYYKMLIDDVDVDKSRIGLTAEESTLQTHFIHVMRICGSDDATLGDFATWSSLKTLKVQFRDASTSYDVSVHDQKYNDAFDTFKIPVLKITAIA